MLRTCCSRPDLGQQVPLESLITDFKQERPYCPHCPLCPQCPPKILSLGNF
ncbi:MAG: hypothetical protein LBB88_03055 [Planctomycetaceae bacterium]|nr:hypothetical protein [Planctomycetaceae bacterium]